MPSLYSLFVHAILALLDSAAQGLQLLHNLITGSKIFGPATAVKSQGHAPTVLKRLGLVVAEADPAHIPAAAAAQMLHWCVAVSWSDCGVFLSMCSHCGHAVRAQVFARAAGGGVPI